jgi:5-methylcytosine-specific restriction endonuclease McrA
VRREDVFARDGYRCVYCGAELPAEALTVDHVQPRVRGGDASGGNLVTACGPCNVRKGHRALAEFLADEPGVADGFRRRAVHVWPRHLRALEEEIRARRRRGR